MTIRKLPRGVWLLGLVSLLMDTSSEMVHALLPVFLVGTLGASAFAVGLIEGVALAAALITRAFSGTISDWIGRRKVLVVCGYGLAAASKPLFALASGVGMVFWARFVDRIGKGIRGAPRDALMADITSEDVRGAAYGLRHSLDTVGAVLGPLVAIGLMTATADDFRAVFWVATVPAVLAVAVLVVGVREPARVERRPSRLPIRRSELARLSRAYWGVVALGGAFHLARFSEAFLMLRAVDVGVVPALVPIMLLVMSAFQALIAYPAGALSDRVGRVGLLAAGLVALIAADAVLALAGDGWAVGAGVALWGVHLGLTDGAMTALVADTAPKELRGTAFGLFSLVSGGVLLVASVVAGLLWDQGGPPATFWTGLGFATLALAGLLLRRWRRSGAKINA